jgi:hypothetical protein
MVVVVVVVVAAVARRGMGEEDGEEKKWCERLGERDGWFGFDAPSYRFGNGWYGWWWWWWWIVATQSQPFGEVICTIRRKPYGICLR